MPENAIPQVPQPDDAVVGKEAGALMLATACAARDAFYATLGTMDADVLAPLVNPAFMGGATLAIVAPGLEGDPPQ